jgi:hypothetical protein
MRRMRYLHWFQRRPLLSLVLLAVLVPFCGGALRGCRGESQHIPLSLPPPPPDPEAEARATARRAEIEAIVKCRQGVRHRAPGAELHGAFGDDWPQVERVQPRLWRWHETGVLNGGRFGYVCRFNPEAGNMIITHGTPGNETLWPNP